MRRSLKTATRHASQAQELSQLLWINVLAILALLFLLVVFKSA
jgi:hypothetical protein